ncbi:MBL fold metallo-hydrolase [Sulfitobacter sp. S0837]|uniref:MBL fold metallo-hydrolase n=1 Tax=Sulfitobacter maritimus TaxID=2741719 RepID=UPI0015817083|nr:MBL fold metallo-hydrolase [Sulfitobacter maritimus]NUH64278.1 MBL fold metallo-hydrolase [Sulfitobacter maritimus]
MRFTRRTVLAGMGGMAVAQSPLRALAAVSANIGEYEIISVSDGNLVLPRSFFFDGLPQEELATVLAPYDLPAEELTPPCNVTLLRHADRVVLFDAGAGPAFMPSAGMLQNSLEAAGVSTEDVTHVVFTHAHPDHLWGVLDDFDDLVFPNATYLMGADEWNYWRDPNTVDTIGEARAAFAVGAARRLEAIEERLEEIKDGQEILPGVMAHASFGHTPGHMSFEVRQNKDAVLIGGDAIGNHHVAFARPEWPNGADQDAERGAKTRVRLLDKLAQEQISLLGFHLPNGGLGRVERAGDSYRFVGEAQ